MSTETIRVFIVDDHPMVRTGLVAMIAGESDLTLAGEAADGQEALSRIPLAEADVVLVDLLMPRMDGPTLIGRLAPLMPSTRFVVLTSLIEPSEVDRAFAAGAHGYVLKNASAHELAETIRSTHAGRRPVAPEVTDALIAGRQKRQLGTDLTQRERELLALMAKGHNNREIAASLNITVPTVKFHVTNVLAKLHAENRTEAVLTALKFKLVPAP